MRLSDEMQLTPKTLLAGLLVLGLTFAGAFAENDGFNPKTFMLGDFVFARPESWVWVPKEDDKVSQKFSIPGHDGEEVASIIMIFYPAEKGTNHHNSGTIIPSWKTQFEPRTLFRTKKVEAGEHEVTFVRVEGTQRSSKTRKEKRPDFALSGAVIETTKGTISARVVGPRSIIDDAEKDLQQMIKGGL